MNDRYSFLKIKALHNLNLDRLQITQKRNKERIKNNTKEEE